MNKEKIDQCVNRVRVVATQAFTRLAFWFKKLIGGIKAMARWLSDKACAAINQLKEKAKMKKSPSESCGHDPSADKKLCPSNGTEATQPQKEEVASVSTSSETPEKTESSEKESDPHPAETESPKGEMKEKEKRIVSFKVKKPVPSRMAKTAPASVAKPVPAPVAKPASAPVDESASLAPVTEPPAESLSDEQPVDDHGSCRVKLSTHELRRKKNRSNLDHGANDLSLRKDSRLTAANASGETASSLLRERIDFDLVCFLGFGIGMAIIGLCLGYGTWRLLGECLEYPLVFIEAILLTSVFVTSSMLAWALYLGMLTNGRRGFVKTFKGWLIIFVLTIFVFMCIGGKAWNDLKEAEAAKEAAKEAGSATRSCGGW